MKKTSFLLSCLLGLAAVIQAQPAKRSDAV